MEITRRVVLRCGVALVGTSPVGVPLVTPSGALAATPPPSRRLPAPHVARPQAAPLPLVLLDPGHGGKDPGAIGVSGTYEKHIAFAAATELKRRLDAAGRYRVRLTRTRDVFIPLDDRAALGQAAGAALFVSMHADAVSDPGVRGASVYTLAGEASDPQSAALATRENSADRFADPSFGHQPPAVARILASLVRQETRSNSARMQRDMVGALGGSLPMLTNPARHAAFAVLRAADVPSVLVEMGFMSNPQDEAALRQAPHRALIAQAAHRAIDGFFAGHAALAG